MEMENQNKDKIEKKYNNVVQYRDKIIRECLNYKTGLERENCDYIIELFNQECKRLSNNMKPPEM